MADNNTTIVLPEVKSEAQIILDWDDGQWYISSIKDSYGTSGLIQNNTTDTTTSSGVKVPEWNDTYKYSENDIVAYHGQLYTSHQNQNQNNSPEDGTFWWKPLVDLTQVDAITLEGKNLAEISRDILGGNVISDYYKKSEVDNRILIYVNNIDAKKLNGWNLQDIKDDYNAKINASSDNAENNAIFYFTDEDQDSYQNKVLIELFNENIAPDNINKA